MTLPASVFQEARLCLLYYLRLEELVSLLIRFSRLSLLVVFFFLFFFFLGTRLQAVEDSTVAGLVRFLEQLDQWVGVSLDESNSS